MPIKWLWVLFLCIAPWARAQEDKIRIKSEESNNRILLYAYNESETDYDVRLTVSGTHFRQSRAKPRFIRVPAASRVHMWTLIPIRGKQASYTYELEITDSLSNRSLQKEFEKIKVNPARQVVLYLPAACEVCDSLMADMEAGMYRFTAYPLRDHAEIRDQLQRILGGQPVDSLTSPIVNLGGSLHTDLHSYDEIMTALREE